MIKHPSDLILHSQWSTFGRFALKFNNLDIQESDGNNTSNVIQGTESEGEISDSRVQMQLATMSPKQIRMTNQGMNVKRDEIRAKLVKNLSKILKEKF